MTTTRSDEPIGQQLQRKIATLRAKLEKERFAGANPALAVTKRMNPIDAIAHGVAAERANVPILFESQSLNLLDDLAIDDFQLGVSAARSWDFREAAALLDRSAVRTSDPLLSQRATLWRHLVGVLQRVIQVEITEALRPNPADALARQFRDLDRLETQERDHYRREITRILEARSRAATDRYWQSVWCVLRCRLTQRTGDALLAGVWLLRALALQENGGSPYLQELAEEIRQALALEMTGGPLTAEPGSARSARPYEFQQAVAAHIDTLYGGDVVRDATVFVPVLYSPAGG